MGRRGRPEKEGAWPLLGGEGRQKKGRETEGGNKGMEEKGRDGKLEQGRRMAKAGPDSIAILTWKEVGLRQSVLIDLI